MSRRVSCRRCSVPGCGHMHKATGLCNRHYQRRKARARVIHASICQCAACNTRRDLAYREEIAGRESLARRAS